MAALPVAVAPLFLIVGTLAQHNEAEAQTSCLLYGDTNLNGVLNLNFPDDIDDFLLLRAILELKAPVPAPGSPQFIVSDVNANNMLEILDALLFLDLGFGVISEFPADVDGDGIVEGSCNSPPVADAGPDQIVECTSPTGASVTLDGTLSSDPDGDPLSFQWRDSANNLVGTTPQVNFPLPLGTHTFTLVLNDGQVDSAPDTVVVTVRDTTPPTVTASLDLIANGDGDGDGTGADSDEGLFQVNFSVSDICDSAPNVSAVLVVPGLVVISVTNGQPLELEPEADEPPEIELENGILEIEGASFILAVTATDSSGNVETATATAAFATGDNDGPEDLDD